ncbi:unnamed protein product [Coregonus sp. 'balchen']|nr:unnamed protein product [Coregonus sp. 'balchen']
MAQVAEVFRRVWSKSDQAWKRESISLLAKPMLDTGGPRLGSMGAVFIMLKSGLGAGLLNFPWAFEKAGGIRTAVAVEMCHKACITIYSSMQNKSLSHWVFISVVTIFFCLIIYSLTGVYGYLTFGKDVAADILMSYTGDDVLMIIARLLFGISIITIYPIILLLGRSVIQDPLLSFRWCFHVVTESYENRSHVGLTRAWITVTLIAMFIPDISKVISVIGGISAFSIFIFPVVLTTWGIITLICGAFIFGQSTTIAIMQLLTKI